MEKIAFSSPISPTTDDPAKLPDRLPPPQSRAGVAHFRPAQTLLERYCTSTGCPAAQFVRQLLWQALPIHARILAPVLGGIHGKYFAADRELISAIARARDFGRVNEKIGDYLRDPRNRSGWRSWLPFRLSITRLRLVAQTYLPERSAPNR